MKQSTIQNTLTIYLLKRQFFLIVTTIRDKIFETKKRIQVKLDRTIKRSHLNFHTFLTATARKFLSEKENGH